MMVRRMMVAVLVAATAGPATVEAKPASGQASGPVQTAPAPTPYPPGTCFSDTDCYAKCGQHAATYTRNGYGDKLVGTCENACATQGWPGHPGEYMAKCIESGAKDLECVQSLVDLNLCLFQAAADPVESAKCAAAVSPSCL